MHFRIFKMVATNGFVTALEYTKFDCGEPGTPLGELTVLPRPSDWFKGHF